MNMGEAELFQKDSTNSLGNYFNRENFYFLFFEISSALFSFSKAHKHPDIFFFF